MRFRKVGVIEVPHNYAIVIFFSDEDEGFIAVVPELAGCSAFGETEEEALSEVKVAIGLWLDTAREEGQEIPEPGGREHLREILAGKGAPGEQIA
ncbi:hypothetical protein ES707_08848 [subsurface metagenome]